METITENRPWTGAKMSNWTQNEIHGLVEKQKAFFKTGKTRNIQFRIESLKKLENILVKKEKQIIDVLKQDLGKPQLEAYSTEVAYVLEDIRYVLKNIQSWAEPQSVSSPLVLQPAKSQIYSEPFGVTLIIAPWNYPFQLTVSPLIGALAAGNTAVLKPSEATPKTQQFLVELIKETFAPEHVTCIGGDVKESQMLLEEKFDFIFFTGSTRVGQIVMEKAAKHLTPVCLELGGKSPCIVDQDIDLAVAAKRIIWGKFMNAGQTCVCPDYLYVHENIYDQFLGLLKSAVTEFYGDGNSPSDSFARIVNTQHFDRLTTFLKSGTIECGGKYDRDQKWIAPTILTNADWSSPVMQEEIFGPILPIMKYSNLEHVLETLNAKPKPLALYVFSKNKNIQEQILSNTAFGGACVNDCLIHLANSELPFGGIGASGMGGYHGKFSFDLFSHKKSVLKKPFIMDAAMRYPPYTDWKLKLIRFFMG